MVTLGLGWILVFFYNTFNCLENGIIIVGIPIEVLLPLLLVFRRPPNILVGSHLRYCDDNIVVRHIQHSLNSVKAPFLTHKTPIPIPMTNAGRSDPAADIWNGNWHRHLGGRRFPSLTWTRNVPPCLFERQFCLNESFGNWRPLLCGCTFSNVEQSGNRHRFFMRTPISKFRSKWERRRVIMQTQVSDLIVVWKPTCSRFLRLVSDFIAFWELACIISWKPVSGTAVIWKSESGKYWTPFSKNTQFGNWHPKILYVDCQNIFNLETDV